jgi:DNA-binding NarL/FixJ family response regulator
MSEETDSALREISIKLDQAIRLLAISVTAGKKQRDQIAVLSRAGFDRHDIAEILGTTPGTVSVELSVLKKLSRKEKRSD